MCEASEANPFEIPTAPRQPFELSDDLALVGRCGALRPHQDS